MKKAGFSTKDWFLGLAVAIVLFLPAGSDLRLSPERRAYEFGLRAAERAPSDRVALIASEEATSGSRSIAER